VYTYFKNLIGGINLKGILLNIIIILKKNELELFLATAGS
jgi:hypothetical protein